MRDLFPGRDFAATYDNLRRQGAPFGLQFAERSRLSNSRLALMAGEFAGESGAFERFHEGIFRAYFADGCDIGDRAVIFQVAAAAGLDADALAAALKQNRYRERLAATQAEAQALGIRSVPTFIINGRERLVGAQPVARFRQLLKVMAAEAGS